MQNRIIFKLLLMLILVILLFNMPAFRERIEEEKIFLFSVLTIFAIVLHAYYNIQKNWFRIDILFLLGYFIVHLQWPFLYSLSSVTISKIGVLSIHTNVVNYSTWMVSIGILFWIIGYNLFYNSTQNSIIVNKYKYRYKILLIICLISFVGFLLSVGTDFLSGVYRGVNNWGGISTQLYLLFHISFLIIFTIEFINKSVDYKGNFLIWFFSLNKLILTMFFSYIIFFLMIGDRGGPLSVIMVLGFLVAYFIRPIKLNEFLIAIFVGAMFMTVISLGRNTDSNILVQGYESLDVTSVHEITKNLAQSTRTLYTAVNYVPEHRDYFYGEMLFGGMLSAIPFLQRFYLELTDGKYHELLSAEYITYLTWGKNPHTGEGTTIVADLYLNFGIYGVVIFLFLLGIFIKKVEFEVKQNNKLIWLLFAVMIISIALYWSRAQYMLPIRSLSWTFLFTIIYIKKDYLYNEYKKNY